MPFIWVRWSKMIAPRKMPSEISVAPVPVTRSLRTLRKAAADCKACPLWRNATAAVFGEGPVRASWMLVGEQPGDQEDRTGRPFVGPAGKLLDRALEAAGVKRDSVYVTNAVKHFKWTPQGKRRLHARPNAREMAACKPWLQAEIEALRPKLIVCLGATAARQVFGRTVKVTEMRGKTAPSGFGVDAGVTLHPSALLRHADTGDFEAEFAALVADLKHYLSA